jgi:hypothetical protein
VRREAPDAIEPAVVLAAVKDAACRWRDGPKTGHPWPPLRAAARGACGSGRKDGADRTKGWDERLVSTGSISVKSLTPTPSREPLKPSTGATVRDRSERCPQSIGITVRFRRDPQPGRSRPFNIRLSGRKPELARGLMSSVMRKIG